MRSCGAIFLVRFFFLILFSLDRPGIPLSWTVLSLLFRAFVNDADFGFTIIILRFRLATFFSLPLPLFNLVNGSCLSFISLCFVLVRCNYLHTITLSFFSSPLRLRTGMGI